MDRHAHIKFHLESNLLIVDLPLKHVGGLTAGRKDSCQPETLHLPASVKLQARHLSKLSR